MNSHFQAMLFCLLVFFGLGLSFFGWGRFILLCFRGEEEAENAPVSLPLWLGWCLTMWMLQFLHLFFPIQIGITIAVYSPGFIYALWLIRRISPARPLWLLTLVGALVLAVAIHAFAIGMLPPRNLDSGLYHFNAIRWLNSYPIITGLGNLHGRLAFNQSFFSYVAALNFFPFFGHGRTLATTSILLLAIFTCLDSLRRAWLAPPGSFWRSLFCWIPPCCILPVLAHITLSSNGLASPSPDATTAILQMMLFLLLCQEFGRVSCRLVPYPPRILCILLLAATSVTVKLSSLVFVGMVGFVLLSVCLIHNSRLIKPILWMLAAASVIVLTWAFRGYLLSGAPLYPSHIFYFPTEWAVDKARMTDDANWIYSWARQPGVHWEQVLGSWNWLAIWFNRNLQNSTTIVFPTIIWMVINVACLLSLSVCRARWKSPDVLCVLIQVPVVVGLAFWFFSAPSPRFAYALFFLLPVSALVWAAVRLQALISGNAYKTILVLILIGANYPLIDWALWIRNNMPPASKEGFHAIPTEGLIQWKSESGLVVFSPAEGDLTWDAPLPATPYPDYKLELRIPGDLAGGFRTAPFPAETPTQFLINQSRNSSLPQ